MADATAFPPTSSCRSTQSIAFSQPAGHSSPSIMASSSERRGDLHDSDGPSRPSLPSIAKIISPSRHNQTFFQKPVSYRLPLPSPFVSVDRAYQDREKHSMPQSIHQSSFTSRQDHISSFSRSSQPSSNDRPEFITVDRGSTTSGKAEHPPPLTPTNCEEPRSVNNSHPSQGPHSSHSYQNNQLPPVQIPSYAYPNYSRLLTNEYNFRRAPYEHSGYARSNNEHLLARQYEPWNYQETLGRISSLSRTIFTFAETHEAYQQGQRLNRMPAEQEVSAMLKNVDRIKYSLKKVREVIKASMQPPRRDGPTSDHDVPVHAGPIPDQHHIGGEGKKHIHSNPLGRCHSCNQIETPEWRRGPNGARTLCNACGLQYAKLEKTRQLETNRQLERNRQLEMNRQLEARITTFPSTKEHSE